MPVRFTVLGACGTIVGHTGDNEGNVVDDLECGKPATYVYKDGTFFCCEDCYQTLDPDIQVEWKRGEVDASHEG